METGGLSGLGEETELGLVEAVEGGLEAGGFLAAAAADVLDFTPLAVAEGVFLAAGAPGVVLAPLVAGLAPVGFLSPTLVVLLEAGAPTVPAGFLEGAVVGVLFLSAAGVVFLATPLV